jgi:hypothetical protein
MSEKVKPGLAAPPVTLPSHVLLLDDWGRHRAGAVLSADADLVAALGVEKTRYREATARERALAGIA